MSRNEYQVYTVPLSERNEEDAFLIGDGSLTKLLEITPSCGSRCRSVFALDSFIACMGTPTRPCLAPEAVERNYQGKHR